MQFDRSSDGTLTPLPKPSIDTGAGLERVSAVLQGVLSNYETDLFVPLIARAAELTGFTAMSAAEAAGSEEKGAASLRIIADHARAATFLISDGVHPANDGRGYVLRKILRRGIRHGRLLGQEKPFMHEMVFAVRDEMQVAYPELKETAERVSKVVLAEEEQFARVLARGAQEFEYVLHEPQRQETGVILAKLVSEGGPAADIARAAVNRKEQIGPAFWEKIAESIPEDDWGVIERSLADARWVNFPGDRAFSLYEDLWLPLDFMVDAARDAGFEFDMEGFETSEGRGAGAGAGFLEGWVAEVGGSGLSGVAEDGV